MKASYLLIGEGSAVKKLNKQIQQLGGSSRNVLVEGEPGVGKTTVARYIHLSSNARNKPFITINSWMTSDDEIKAVLLRDEITSSSVLPGKQVPELVDGSVVYIKDLEELSFSNQSRIARFLDAKRGKMRIRVIATMREPLEKCHESGRLIDGLYEKLSAFERVAVPPLRERPEDIPAMAEHFAREACKELGVRMKSLDVNTLDFLVRYDWKANIRELKAVIDKATHQSEGEMLSLPREFLDEKSHLQGIISNIDAKKRFSMDLALENIEKLLLQRMLKVFGFNQTRVAEALGITEGNLRYRLKKYSIPSSRQR